MNIDTRKIVRVISLIVLIASLCVLAVYVIGDLRDAKTEDAPILLPYRHLCETKGS